jgi:hypothetical protein
MIIPWEMVTRLQLLGQICLNSLSLSLSLNYFSSGLASSTTVLEQSSLTKQERKPFTDKNCFLSAYKTYLQGMCALKQGWCQM